MTRFTSKQPRVPMNKIACTVRKNRYDTNTELRLDLEANDDWSSDLMRTLLIFAWKNLEATEESLLTELRWNGMDGPWNIRSHTHTMIGNLSCSVRSTSQQMTAQSSGYADETEERASPSLPSTLDSSPIGSTRAEEPERMYCTST
ncbi:hypothetical protein KM707_gp4 [Coconut foliar decay alphasatellite 2]|uniref:Uncharacterized protein n=1 Tax=Coconut foliar decay alphasatellite 2 TaxID=2161875 RepID=A0A2R4N8W3_9VIRU|nr:hypothetical protein KM707_gp4 [Coconut foliar decay alphasatellite 2]AVX29421.1 hypothetical protein [Coconut foliar decay alphasatellite 2]